MNRRVFLAALGGTLLAPAAPASAIELAIGQRVNVPVTSMKDIKFQRTLRQQYDFSCGSAALATLLTHHYGTATCGKTAFEWMWANGDKASVRPRLVENVGAGDPAAEAYRSLRTNLTFSRPTDRRSTASKPTK